MENIAEGIVVPLVKHEGELSSEVMLRMLMNRDALVVHRVEDPRYRAKSGLVASTSGAFSKALGQVLNSFTKNTGNKEEMFRLVLPSGSVARDLVPAVGGGFRGIVREAGSTKIVGQARLLPVAAGGGAAMAAGPLLATVGLAVGAEMLAQHQINAKLDLIANTVTAIHNNLNAQDQAILTTAQKQASKVAGYLLDQATIPTISSASHAFGELDSLTTRYLSKLDQWSEAVAKHSIERRVYTSDLMRDLTVAGPDPIADFERQVTQMYHAIALRARVIVLEKIAAEHSNPDRSLKHVESVLRSELADLADRQTQLTDLLDDLNVLPLDSTKIPVVRVSGKKSINVRTSFGRLARAMHRTPNGIPVLSDSEESVVELERANDGFAVVQPSSVQDA